MFPPSFGKMGIHLPNWVRREEEILSQWSLQSFLFNLTPSINLVFQSLIVRMAEVEESIGKLYLFPYPCTDVTPLLKIRLMH